MNRGLAERLLILIAAVLMSTSAWADWAPAYYGDCANKQPGGECSMPGDDMWVGECVSPWGDGGPADAANMDAGLVCSPRYRQTGEGDDDDAFCACLQSERTNTSSFGPWLLAGTVSLALFVLRRRK